MLKQEFEAGMKVLTNLYEQAQKVSLQMAKAMMLDGADEDSGDCGYLANRLLAIADESAKNSGTDDLMQSECNKIAENLRDCGGEIVPPTIAVSLEYGTPIVAIKYQAGDGAFVAETGTSDFGTKGLFVGYDLDKDRPAAVGNNYIDVCYLEVKKGALAENSGLAADNKDVDVYAYEDPYQEDYTRKFRLEYSDMENVLSEEE